MQKLSGLFLLTVLLSGAFSSSFAFAQVGPIAENDLYSINEDSILTVGPLGVLLNDANTDSDTFVAILKTDVGFGTLTLNSDGSLTYQPNQNFDSTDSFTYVANDGTNDSNEATVTISVNPINDTPTANDDIDSTLEDTAVTTAVIANDSDADGDDLQISEFDVTSTNGGSITLDDNETPDDATDDKLTYTPLLNFVGSDTYSYVITDGTLQNTATVTIVINPVNDAPTANDDIAETLQNVPVSIDILENDSDTEEDSLNIFLQVDPSETKGSAEIQDSKVIFTPNTDFVGETTFSYMISDGQNTSNSATVTVTVTPVENPDDGTVLDQILDQIQSIFDKILNIEDEITQLREENSALVMRLTELESIVENGVPTNDNDDENDDEKVLVCHKDKETISIFENGLSGHLKHGDSVGECSDNNESSSKKEIQNQIKALKNDFKAQEKELKNQLKDLKKDKKSHDDEDDD